jgi:hypothetical protein
MKTPKQARASLITLSGLAILAMSALACDPGELDDSPDVDEPAVLDDDMSDPRGLSETLEIGNDEVQPEAPALPGKLDMLPSPNDVWIESVNAFGIGCPGPGSTQVDIASSKQSFIIIFKDMLLTNPGGAPIKTTNCVASVKLHIPGGWQVSVATINTRGYAFLESGMKARNTTNYFFAGDPVGYAAHTELQGPYDGLYTFTDQVPFQSVVWSPCGTSSIFAIDTSMVLNAISNPSGNGIFNNTTLDGSFKKILHLQWQQC